MSSNLVIIPTYNEKENIENIIRAVFDQPLTFHVLIIEDGSPDGTAAIVKALQTEFSDRLFMVERKGKLGLGTAYITGFKWALEHGYEYIFEMDADFSHDPAILPIFIEKSKEHDLIIGSRYLHGISVVNWPLRRLMLSYGANVYTRLITGLKIMDCTSGFKCFRRSLLERIDLDRVRSDGYSFQIEMNFHANQLGARITEVPIVFIDRRAGHSKMSKKIVREAIFMVWKLKLGSLFGKGVSYGR